MFAVTGITGQVGGAVAATLLEKGKTVRAVVRDPSGADAWAARGAEVASADLEDADALAAAFRGTEGVFVMVPPYFTPKPGYPEARRVCEALARALAVAKPPRVVALSSIGAQRESGLGLITQVRLMEDALRDLPVPVAFLRAGSFIENERWDVGPARGGEIPAFYAPVDRPLPLVSTDDIGRVGAETLLEAWEGVRVVEVEGPVRYTMNDVAAAFAKALGRPVRAVEVARDRWSSVFEAGAEPGSSAPRAEMLDGFNSGWIEFERPGGFEPVRGRITLDDAIARIVRDADGRG